MEEREQQDQEDKTEDASEERRKQYREEGQIPNPREVVHSLVLLLIASAAEYLLSQFFVQSRLMFHRFWQNFRIESWNSESVSKVILNGVAPLLPMIAISAAVLFFVPSFVGLLLTRFNWTWKPIEPNFGKLNPISGIGRLVSASMLPELIKSLIKIMFLGVASYLLIKDAIIAAPSDIDKGIPALIAVTSSVIFRLLMAMSLISLVIGFADFSWSWWKLEKQMRMTKKEVKDEMKNTEGDPHVKGQRRRMARDIVMAKAIRDVPKATFVVTNPEHFAVAIRYVKGMSAPIVVAKGMDFLALRIKEIAKTKDIIIIENKPLARTLYKMVKIGQEVPPSLYASIIEVMKYIYRAKGKDYFDKIESIKVP